MSNEEANEALKETIDQYLCHFSYKLFENVVNEEDQDSYQLEEDHFTDEITLESISQHSLAELNTDDEETEEKLIPNDLFYENGEKNKKKSQNSHSKMIELGKSRFAKLLGKVSDKENEMCNFSCDSDSNSTQEDKATEHEAENEKEAEIKPELQKFVLPKSLFETMKSEESTKNTKDTLTINLNTPSVFIPMPQSNCLCPPLLLNLSSKPYVPKRSQTLQNPTQQTETVTETTTYILRPIVSNQIQNKNKFNPFLREGYNKSKVFTYTNINREAKKKKKKREFVEREGDWSCYRCKNVNFSFRDKCNKCGFTKDESEKKFQEVGEQLLKLADPNIYKKKD